MCGISGVYNFGTGEPVDPGLLKRMTGTIRHRGPDDDGFFMDGSIGLGFRRLSIIDVAGGHQPIYNEDGSCAIIFNGEIYNYAGLRSGLLARGHRFKTNSDTETILHLYEEQGADCVQSLRGMFAFAIWDAKRRQLMLARDRLGIKPLYYFLKDGRCVFGSEIKPILCDAAVPREIDLQALSDYVSLGYIPSPKTIFQDIRKLPAGHYLVINPEQVAQREYWDVHFGEVSADSPAVLTQRLTELLQESVSIRLMSEVPLGAFLSGGVDSSAVVALMSDLLSEPVITNSIGFPESSYDETCHARAVADRFHTNHHEYTVKPQALEILDTLSWHYDEPFADSSAIPTYYVSKVARENVTVALTGDGGDENFAGYRRYRFDRLENRMRRLIPTPVRRHVIGSIAKLYPKADWAPQVFRGKTLLTNLSGSPEAGYFNTMSAFKEAEKGQLFKGEMLRELHGYSTYSVFDDYFRRCDSVDPLSRVQYVDIKTYLVDDILTKVDRASMAVSLEARAPLLDHKLTEFAATIPSHLKLSGQSGKHIFKQAMGHRLPEEILHRRKMGFAVPLDVWFRRDIKEFAHDLLLGGSSGLGQYINLGYVRRLWNHHQSGVRDHSTRLWILLMFELWLRKFMINRGAV
ncbi:MAG: asparagine synthase (glutamine-hydrolyzing) [Acidobacteria bacterium]|nr:asparagine synthase (glutamine-hydrolyzing) [Acidobacteriota bacterium]MBI3655265.1 asparagine synthase (glutamine-hydrolyzing) [Acidobacteriota bacterium]